METFNYIIGILGFILSVIGTYFTYISFINPIKRFDCLLKNNNNWEQFIGVESHLYYYRHKKYPSFQLVIDWDKVVVENFQEEWINDGLYPDKTNNASYYVKLEANGMLLDKELFVSLDGHRWFVPVPRVRISKLKKDKREFYYDKRQIQLANIVSKYHFQDKNIYAFAEMQNKPISIKNNLMKINKKIILVLIVLVTTFIIILIFKHHQTTGMYNRPIAPGEEN